MRCPDHHSPPFATGQVPLNAYITCVSFRRSTAPGYSGWLRKSLFLRFLALSFFAPMLACKEHEQPSSADQSDHRETGWSQPVWSRVSDGLAESLLSPSSLPPEAGVPQFEQLGPRITGIDFRNQLNEQNIKNYLLTGAGLAVGDVDANGLPDLFLVSQDGPNKLYLQMSPWNFIDHTEVSGIRDTEAWGSGAAFADIDNE